MEFVVFPHSRFRSTFPFSRSTQKSTPACCRGLSASREKKRVLSWRVTRPSMIARVEPRPFQVPTSTTL
ncbi:hypothetical protein ATCV1_z348L [Acanthocystis turfacea chlorella virus 1]|uniref:Uncharacterized protein z348L n=1 Tax=Chlorovirus heliozoae TaxID=322019 RepID=A7K8V8_9PHYC|nr:hypothetical protein ATCV1_z348L [Acanthocystis turfacea chlorella virus 1]ABT16482.1 hypothetical protein ATCV1_z348L [Acanthocystis turfacea chlorella virus 1]